MRVGDRGIAQAPNELLFAVRTWSVAELAPQRDAYAKVVEQAFPGLLAGLEAVLHTVPDPEVPVLSVCDLGLVRELTQHADALEVVLTPTYSGCPATEVIAQSVHDALVQAGLGPITS